MLLKAQFAISEPDEGGSNFYGYKIGEEGTISAKGNK
jgi:hypothetical protein